MNKKHSVKLLIRRREVIAKLEEVIAAYRENARLQTHIADILEAKLKELKEDPSFDRLLEIIAESESLFQRG